MYGLINKAVEGLVRSRFGDAVWDRVRSRAGLPDEPFLSMEQYDDNGELLVCQLLKSIYGLKQSPRNWNHYIHDWLMKHGFRQSANDPGIYIHVENGALLALYVDDLILAAKDIEYIRRFKKDFNSVGITSVS